MSPKSWVPVLLIALALPAGDLLFSWFRYSSSRACEPGTTPTVPTFAYSPLRPGSVESCLSAHSFAGLAATKLELPFTPTPAMLLYWNGIRQRARFAGKRVLLGQGYPASVYAYDLDARAVLWRHDFYADRPGLKPSMPINSSAPVLDEEQGRIYGTFIEEKFVGNKPTDSRLTQHYYSIRLDGTEPRHVQVDLAPFALGPGTQATPDDIRKYLRCRAALGLNTEAKEPYLYSGCSIVRAFSFQGSQFVHHASSQTVKGIRGLLLALPVNRATGEFGAPRAFVPSKAGPHPAAGVDAGIWLSGGAPTQLPGNHLLVPTGNGVFRPTEQVFGCAVLRLDGDRLAVEPRDATFFSAKGRDVDEAGASCHQGNLDPSSSAVATLQLDGRYYSAIGGKDGWIKSFDPLQLPGTRFEPSRELRVIEGYLFGQPVLFPSAKFHALAAIGGNGAHGVRWAGYSLGAGHALKELWSVEDRNPRAFNTSAAGTYRAGFEGPLLLIPLASSAPSEGFRASLQAVNALTGRVLSETPFDGAAHFSMPTVVDDRVFVPTAEHGIYELRARAGFRNFLRVHSFFRALY